MRSREAKQFLSYLLAVIMLVSMVPVQIFATEEVIIHDHEVTTEDPSVLDLTGDVDIPVLDLVTEPIVDETSEAALDLTSGSSVTSEPVVDSSSDLLENGGVTDSEQAGDEVTSEREAAQERYVKEIVAEIDAFLVRYGIAADMTDEEIEDAIYEIDDEGFDKIAEIEERVNNAPEVEGIEFTEEEQTAIETYGRFCGVLEQMNSVSFFAETGSHTPVTGITVGVSGATDNSMGNGAVTVTAKGSGGLFGIGARSKTATITVTNSSSAAATISFNWTATSVNKLTIDGKEYSGANGTFSKLLEGGASFTITIVTGKNSTENKLEMSNFGFKVAAAESVVTFVFDSSLGTIMVDGNTVASGNSKSIPSSGANVSAFTSENVVFLGWMDESTRDVQLSDVSGILKVSESTTIRAVFAHKTSKAWFKVGNKLFDDLNEAKNAVGDLIVLAADGTLPAGEYTIPKGKTLLIPFDANPTLFTDEPAHDSHGTWTTPVAFRTLIMASGASINVNGSISVSAKHHSGDDGDIHTGGPTGNVGFIQMNQNSSIQLNTGSTLYAWGYIVGNGSVNALAGSTVYEYFQFTDFRGGTHSSKDSKEIGRVFPINQYYIQNIEVPLTINVGAIEYCRTTINTASMDVSANVKFIADSGAMFNLNGKTTSITKKYDGEEDRLVVDIDGNITLSPLKINLELDKLGFVGSIAGALAGLSNIDSAEYVLPITNNLTANFLEKSTITISQDIAVLPGAEINIFSEATCTLSDNVVAYAYDASDWKKEFLYYDSNKSPVRPNDESLLIALPYAPGRTYNRTDEDIVDASIRIDGVMDASLGYVYTTDNGANIYSTAEGKFVSKKGTEKETFQYNMSKATLVAISISPAVLKNSGIDPGADYEETFPNNVPQEFLKLLKPITFVYNGEKWEHVCEDNEDRVIDAATCLTAGVVKNKCRYCGVLTTIDTIPALGHTTVTDMAVEATCTQGGLTAGSHCTACGEVFVAQENTDKKAHDTVTDEAVEATCTQGGLTAGSHCKACGEVFVAQENTDKKAHETVIDEAVEATCTRGGLTEGSHCVACGEILEAQETTDQLPHERVTDEAVEATCTRGGLTEGSHCVACGEIFEAQETTDQLPHERVTDEAVEATCTQGGLTEGSHCVACGEIFEAQETTDQLPHEKVTDEAVEATCTRGGLTVGSHCAACGEVFVAQENTDKKAHDTVIDEAVEATCTQGGLTAGSHCAACGEVFVAQENTDKKAHDTVIDEAVEATCTQSGLTIGSHCKSCGEVLVAQQTISQKNHDPGSSAVCSEELECVVCGTKLIPTAGHQTVTISAIAPTCTELGWNEGLECWVCHEVIVAPTSIPKLGHTEVIDEAVEATCTQGGLTAGSHCKTCGEVFVSQETTEKKAHDIVIDEAVEATCTQGGLTAGSHCKACGEVFVAQENTDKKAHDTVIDEAVEATCTQGGLTVGSHCKVCGEVFVAQENTDKKAHDTVTDEAVEATCTRGGLTVGSHCKACGEVFVAQENTDKKAHDTVVDEAVEATCTQGGLTAGSHCKACGEVFVAQENTDKKAHDTVVDEAVEATCTQGGLTAGSHCKACGEVFVAQENTDKKAHDTVVDEAVEATCTKSGLTAGSHCKVCGEVFDAQTTIAALGHTVTTDAAVAATCSGIGWTEGSHCSVCGEVFVVQTMIAALGHTVTTDAAVTATCSGIGWTEGSHCSVCGEVFVTQTTIPALGHTRVTVAAVAATCTQSGLTAKSYCEVCGHVFVAQTVISELGHSVVTDSAIAPTCTMAGITEGKHCTVCGHVLVEQIVVSELGHSWKDADCDTSKYCESCGLTEGTPLGHTWVEANCTTPKTCSVCKVTEGEALGHSIENHPAVNPTCLTVGNYDYVTCKNCDYTTYIELPAMGHVDPLKHYEGVKPTYTKNGWYAYDACTRCDYSTFVERPALGEPTIDSYAEFLLNLGYLEQLAEIYVRDNPTKDPVTLVIKYIRTGVDRYNSGSWGIMAGYEDAAFADFVQKAEEQINYQFDNVEDYLKVSGLKNINNFTLPNGNVVDFGHMFGTMDITQHNKGSQNHADVGGWAGDLVDLMTASDRAYNKSEDSTVHYDVPDDLETMVDQIRYNIFLKTTTNDDKFNLTDWYGDIDALYVMTELAKVDYGTVTIGAIIAGLCTSDLNDADRAETFLKARFGYQGTRQQVRDDVYNAYSSNKVITTLEGTRNFLNTDSAYLAKLRKAVCYAFADYVCELAGDYVDVENNPFYTDFYSEFSTLAPGITYEKHKATSADDKQMVYYLATADLSNPNVHVKANYTNADPTKWEMGRVLDQANAAQAKYGDPESKHYIPNYQVVVSVNSDGFNMTTGEPGGLLIMDGIERHPINSSGFFGITKEGKAVIGTTSDYNTKYKGKLSDAVGAFGTMLVKDGEIAITASSNYYSSRASRTAVGITRTGKVIVMVLDGRQEPVSCGGSMEEIAQIMLEAGCYQAVNLDGGGSTTFVSKPEGEEDLVVTNNPSDGFARSVSSTLIFVSTAPSSTAFDHARLDSDYDYATVGTSIEITPVGVSATGNMAELPTGCAWSVSNSTVGAISQTGVFTGLENGTVDIILSHDGEEVGRKTINVVEPDTVYFTREKMDAVYGASIELPVAALYKGKNVAIKSSDVSLSVNPATAGTCNGYTFTAAHTAIKTVKVTVSLVSDADVKGTMTITLYNQGENSFDFEAATAGDRQLAWDRQVTNSTTSDEMTYTVLDPGKDMVTSYIFAMDMTQIPTPDRLADLVYMLPGADAGEASAWNFLLQLAERVSVLTEVTPVITIDPRFDVDYSELKVMNEYFVIKNREEDIVFDPSNNQLTLKLHWVDQTAAIDPSIANPLCIVSGIKLTPKDGIFDGVERITFNNKAVISYKIYLRANALYSFSQKEENQVKYGLKPFSSTYVDNGVEKPESGGYFENEYKRIEDQYTLSYAKLEGWVHEGTGYAYYINGQRQTGVILIDDLYYDFGETGIRADQKPFTGVFEDKANDNKLRFVRNGLVISSGWNTHGDDTYHCHEDGFASLAKVDNPMTCIRGGFNTYTCLDTNCKKVETVGDFQTPKGHDWDENYVCRKCEFVGINITGAAIGFGTLKDPVNVPGNSVVRYYYSSGGVRPWIYATFNGKNELSWSGDGNVNEYGYVKDLYVTWPNNDGIGNAFVEINGRGNYYGKVTLRYQVIPRDVQNLRATNVTDGAVTLAWDAAAGADWYELYDNQNGVRKYIATIPEGTTVTLTGIEEGRVYNFQIISVANSTDGENREYTCAYWSNTVTIPESAAKPTTPSNPPASKPTPGAGGGGGGGTLDVPVKVEVKQELEPEVTVDRNGKVEFEVGEVAIQNGVQYAIANDTPVVEINPIVNGDAKEMTTIIPHESVKELKANDLGVAVSSPVAGISVKSEALKTVSGDLELTAVENKDGSITISTAVDGKAKDLRDVTVTIPFGKNVAEKDNKFNVLVEVHEDGTETVIKKSVVDGDGVAAIVDSNATVKVAQIEKEFPDTEGHWGESAIDFVAARGIFSGTGTGFNPNGTMTRAMIVTTLFHLEDATARGSHSFPDVPSGKWYSDPVTWAAREGIVSGTGRGFEPNANVTRQQLAVMLYNYAEFVGMDTSARGDLSKFGDHTRVSGWAKEAMEWAIGSGLISGMGNGSLNPQGQATRAQAAVIYEKLIKQMVK